MENLRFYDMLREVPDEAKKPITGGRMKGMTDINPVWRIKKLTEAFGPCGIGWYYTVSRRWLETYGTEVAAFVDIELYVKVGDEWSKPIAGTGGSKFVTKERAGIQVSDECYKMATTDALSVSCKQLGIGADVYFSRDVTKYPTGTPEEEREVHTEAPQKEQEAPQKEQEAPRKEQEAPRKERTITAMEAEALRREALRTDTNLREAMKKKGWARETDIPLAVYEKWMRTMSQRESIPPPAPEGAVEGPPEGYEALPFE